MHMFENILKETADPDIGLKRIMAVRTVRELQENNPDRQVVSCYFHTVSEPGHGWTALEDCRKGTKDEFFGGADFKGGRGKRGQCLEGGQFSEPSDGH